MGAQDFVSTISSFLKKYIFKKKILFDLFIFILGQKKNRCVYGLPTDPVL